MIPYSGPTPPTINESRPGQHTLPSDLSDSREQPLTGDGRRVLRGGSRSNLQVVLCCSARFYDHPPVRNNKAGVRLVCRPPPLSY